MTENRRGVSVQPHTPKAPADSALEFFSSSAQANAPIVVYELGLDPDGGPNKDRQVEEPS